MLDVGESDERQALRQFTCCDCELVDECDLAFDPYNTDGDCLADK